MPIKAGGALAAVLLAVMFMEAAGALSSPLEWLGHGGPQRLLALSVISIIPSFLLGTWALTAPGSRAPLMVMAAVGALPVIAILNGSIYRTAVVKSVKSAGEKLGPSARAVAEAISKNGSAPGDISTTLKGVDGLSEVSLYAGNGYFILSTGGKGGGGEGATIYYHSKTGEWRRFHEDRAQSPAAKEFVEATRGIEPSSYARGEDGIWKRTGPAVTSSPSR